jgi:hypothetical protein
MRTGYDGASGRRGCPSPALAAGQIRKGVCALARNGLCRIWGLPRLPRRRKGRIAKAANGRGRTGENTATLNRFAAASMPSGKLGGR